jgi:ABC-type transporter Mla subunit MlaD
MKLHYAHRLSTSRIAQIIGGFIVVPLIGLVILALFMARTEHLFESKYGLGVTLRNSYGLEPGSAVLISGIPVGRVRAIGLQPGGGVQVDLEILRRYHDMIRRDAVGRVGKSGVIMGQAEIEIQQGDITQPALEAGGRLTVEEPRDYAEVLNEVKPVVDSVQRAIARIEALTIDLQATVQAGGRVMAAVERATAELPGVVASAKRAMASVERTADDMPKVMETVRATVQKADAAVTDVRIATKKLPPLLETAQQAVGNIAVATASVKDLTNELSREVPPLMDRGQQALDDVNRILSGAKKTFPVSTMLRNAPQPAAAPDRGLPSVRGDRGR